MVSKETGKLFCCEGCRSVSSLIDRLGKGHFYNIKGPAKIGRVSLTQADDAYLDHDSVMKKFTTPAGGSNMEVIVEIRNIHCSACVWLNEKILMETEGIVSSVLNFSSGRARIVFDPSRIRLSEILAVIRSIGYEPALFADEKNSPVNTELDTALKRIVTAAFCAGNIMLFSAALYLGYFSGITAEFKRMFHYISWALATPVYLYSGRPFMQGALRSLKNRYLNMDFLIFTGISIAYFYSVFVTLTDRGEVYFDTVCLIYLVVLTGRYMEMRARRTAQNRVSSLLCRLPEKTIILRNGASEDEVPPENVVKGDVLKILPGMRVPVDAILTSYKAKLDESVLTGESLPSEKNAGDRIPAGSICVDSHFLCRAVNNYHDSSLSSLKKKLEGLALEKPRIQLIAERFSSKFIAFVFMTAAATFLFWYFTKGNLEIALVNFISVLIVACPCALGIAVPAALVTNHIMNAERGILLKNPSIIDALRKIRRIYFDKTGTLTENMLEILETTVPDFFFAPVYLAEKNSNHTVAKSICAFLKTKNIYSKLENYNLITSSYAKGQGLSVKMESGASELNMKIGSAEFAGIDKSLEKEGGVVAYLSVNGDYKGYFLFKEKIRPEVPGLIAKLKKQGKEIAILSGDKEVNVRKVADELGITRFHYEMKPEDKAAILDDDRLHGVTTIMTGDGINDSLSISKAAVGISHDHGEDISIDNSEIVLLNGRLDGISTVIELAEITDRVVKENIIISLGYNLIMIPLAAAGFMLPVICALFMTMSSLTVILNSSSIFLRGRNL
ncbi:MAG TPA: heavy metal translocating P-type ATPase metal-binding domain-containing protein [Leptospiraceae bacterium]|nr:heavy metal translocating P-type ATPase metal-binding domain-containing protein [Leptospiraceae bacterium]